MTIPLPIFILLAILIFASFACIVYDAEKHERSELRLLEEIDQAIDQVS